MGSVKGGPKFVRYFEADIDKLLDLLIEEKLGVVETRALQIDDSFFVPYRAVE